MRDDPGHIDRDALTVAADIVSPDGQQPDRPDFAAEATPAPTVDRLNYPDLALGGSYRNRVWPGAPVSLSRCAGELQAASISRTAHPMIWDQDLKTDRLTFRTRHRLIGTVHRSSWAPENGRGARLTLASHVSALA